MALISTILGKTQRVQFNQPSTGTIISVDCTVKETHARESIPSEYPVEDGTTISDNILIKPKTLELEGIISDTPIDLLNTLLTTAVTSVTPNVGILGGAAGIALFSALAKSKKPSVVAFGQLLQIQESRQPFDVITSLETYKNMWIKGLSIPRDANTGQVLIFNLSLVQLIIAQPQSVNLQVFKDPNLGPGEVNKGKQELLTSGSAQGAKAGLNDVNKLLGKFNSLAGGTN